MNHPTLAASAATEEDDDLGTCSICFLAFSASEADHVPRLLKCGHSFCTACLTCLLESAAAPAATATATNAEAEAKPDSTLELRCPKCRRATGVRLVNGEAVAAGVKGLPRNFDLIDLLSSARDHKQQQPRPASAQSCGGCGRVAAEKFCAQCGGAHLCVSCDTQLHALLLNRSHVRVASADAPEPRAACEHHRAKMVEMWCEREGVAVCVVCLVAGPHKGHDAVTIEEAEERVREAARVKLTQVEAAMGEVEAAVERQAACEAGEQESGREARAAIKRHFDRMREAVAQRERVLGAEVDLWERMRAEAAAKRRAELAEAQTRLAAAGKTLQQLQQQQERGGLGRTATWGDPAAARQAARTAAAVATAARGMQASSSCTIAFASEDTWVQAVGSSGRLDESFEQKEAEKADKKKDLAEAHLYLKLRVATLRDFEQSHDVDLCDFEQTMEFKVKKTSTLREFRAVAAEVFGIPAARQRYWTCPARRNRTVRPDEPYEEDTPFEMFAKRGALDIKVFLEASTVQTSSSHQPSSTMMTIDSRHPARPY
jgi:hypothetical protein